MTFRPSVETCKTLSSFKFKTCKENLNDENVLQVSADGPNFIKKFVKKYSAERKNDDLSELFFNRNTWTTYCE